MLTIAYLANQFPVAVEPYVREEIEELRRRGIQVIPGSVRKSFDKAKLGSHHSYEEILSLQPLRIGILVEALLLTAANWRQTFNILKRVFSGNETLVVRCKAVLHTWLGAYYAVLLRKRGIDHIHVHHGYFGSWIAMVASRLLGVTFSLTLHGSDLLLGSAYLDLKLRNCLFCTTVSEYNRRFILDHFPGINPEKIHLGRLGVNIPPARWFQGAGPGEAGKLKMLAVGRLHAVKDHAFLVRACARLRDIGIGFECNIAGEGPERPRLERLIRELKLNDHVFLLGHIASEEIQALYAAADVVVLTSRSEGIPLVLMEAMALGRIVLAPAITGIPELIVQEKTGFLYESGNVDDFIARVQALRLLAGNDNQTLASRVQWIRHAAQIQVKRNFNRQKNVDYFCDLLLQRIERRSRRASHENFVLQQI